ncbi:Rhodanese-related sulfurtransferase [Zalaria obscura]|uniref:Rhodanese-related sulfurtransferase n=1 Tax=Zalaria obscura TaxID=2024903 RepID=A0ACC3SA24_9PEZI
MAAKAVAIKATTPALVNGAAKGEPIPSVTTNGEVDTEMADGEDAAASATAQSKPGRLPITVSKPTPFTFDLGNLLCNDANPLPPSSEITESDISAAARDCAQGLLNQLLSTCPITRSADSTSVMLNIPAPTTPMPREKPVPAEKALTKWQEFAKKKGIKDKKRDTKLVYDEASGEWVPKWGYKGKNKEGENDWLVEVDDDKEKKTGVAGDARKERREERKERIRRQERKMRANERKLAAK